MKVYAVVVALVLGLAGCSGGDAPAPADTPTDVPASSAPAPTRTDGSPGPDTIPGSEPPPGCLDGAYRVTSFRAVGADDSSATGTGGDLSMTFDDGSFAMTSEGEEPATITIGGTSGDLVLNGELAGTYSEPTGNLVTFTAGKSTGKVTLRDAKTGEERTITVDQLADVLAPEDSAAVTCAGAGLTIENQQLTLQLTR